MADQTPYTPPRGARQVRMAANAPDVWVMPDGSFAPGQTLPDGTPLTRAALFAYRGTTTPSGAQRQKDEQGRWYFMSGGKKKYLSPIATGEVEKGPDDPSYLHHGSTWNPDTGDWDNDINWDNIIATAILGGVGGGAVAGAAGAGGGFGGTAVAAGPTSAGGAATGAAPAAYSSSLAGAAPETATAIPGVTSTAGAPITGTMSTSAGAVGSGAGGTSSAIANALRKPSTAEQIATLLQGTGKGIGDAASAQGNNEALNTGFGLAANAQNIQGRNAYIDQVAALARLGLEANDQNLRALQLYQQGLISQEQLRQSANAQNISGEHAFIDENLGMAAEEDKQRSAAYKDVARASLLGHQTSSPYNPRPSTGMNEGLRKTLAALEAQGVDRLSKGADYDTSKLRKPRDYQPITSSLPAMEKPTTYTPGPLPTPKPYEEFVPQPVGQSGLQDTSNWLSPTLSTLSLLAQWYGKGK